MGYGLVGCRTMNETHTQAQIADWLKEAIATSGKRPVDIARILGVTSSRVAEMKNGKRRLRYDEIVKISASLGVPMPQVASEAGDEFNQLANELRALNPEISKRLMDSLRITIDALKIKGKIE